MTANQSRPGKMPRAEENEEEKPEKTMSTEKLGSLICSIDSVNLFQVIDKDHVFLG